ncbi:MAG: hypothetical protein LBI45_05495 [Bacteroidales bacterium]|jgi:hypothetical protein|nr:hypothetical protein [Bacteroidales bacterium]
MKSVLNRNKITPLADRLPSFRCRVRYAHTATKTPRKKMANAIILPLPIHHFNQDFLCTFATLRKESTNIRIKQYVNKLIIKP